jgi:hypothetical protein
MVSGTQGGAQSAWAPRSPSSVDSPPRAGGTKGADNGGIPPTAAAPAEAAPELVRVGQLVPTHGQTMSNKRLDKEIKAMRKSGFPGAVTVTEHQHRLYILDGHHRTLAAPRAGIAEVPVQRVELPWGAYATPDDLNFAPNGY